MCGDSLRDSTFYEDAFLNKFYNFDVPIGFSVFHPANVEKHAKDAKSKLSKSKTNDTKKDANSESEYTFKQRIVLGNYYEENLIRLMMVRKQIRCNL